MRIKRKAVRSKAKSTKRKSEDRQVDLDIYFDKDGEFNLGRSIKIVDPDVTEKDIKRLVEKSKRGDTNYLIWNVTIRSGDIQDASGKIVGKWENIDDEEAFFKNDYAFTCEASDFEPMK